MIDIIYRGAIGLAAGLVYGLFWAARARHASSEPFNPAKLLGTLIVSSAIGAFFGVTGTPVTEANVLAAITAHAGVITLIEPPLKIALAELGWFEQYAGRRETPSHALEDRPR